MLFRHTRHSIAAYSTAKRPLSPHMTIYQPQLTWLMSIGHRVTGAGLAAVIYAWALTVSVTPAGLTEKTRLLLAERVPKPLFEAGRVLLAFPFTFHLWNGVRHLVWDTGRALTLRGVYGSGWAVNVASVASTVGLILL